VGWCSNPGPQIVSATKFCTVAPNIFGSWVRNLFLVTLRALRILSNSYTLENSWTPALVGWICRVKLVLEIILMCVCVWLNTDFNFLRTCTSGCWTEAWWQRWFVKWRTLRRTCAIVSFFDQAAQRFWRRLCFCH